MELWYTSDPYFLAFLTGKPVRTITRTRIANVDSVIVEEVIRARFAGRK
jgi:hypothetical protein